MNKFKIGDMVIPERFERVDLGFASRMDEFIGKPGTITCIDDEPDEHHYQINGWWWPESALILHEPKEKEYVKRFLGQQTLTVAPERKTLGDFMLAALTGLLSSYGNHDVTDYNDIAHDALMAAKAAFELYEKEVNNGK